MCQPFIGHLMKDLCNAVTATEKRKPFVAVLGVKVRSQGCFLQAQDQYMLLFQSLLEAGLKIGP